MTRRGAGCASDLKTRYSHPMEGTALGVDAEGYLVIETLPGKTQRVISGEVRLLDHP